MKKSGKLRADEALVRQGLAPSRSRAQALIMAGGVYLEDQQIKKPGQPVAEDAPLSLKQKDHPWVSRGGVKLAHALEHFELSLKDKTVLDIGASTGGFSDVALKGGAAKVYAVDVGKGQLDWTLREDPRVTVLEGINARHLTPDEFARAAGDDLPDLATLDLSFISATKVLPAVGALLAEDSEIILLAKPQFEAGKGQIGKGGIVRDPAVHRTVLETLWTWAAGNAFGPQAACASPIRGAKGNREFFLYLRPGAEAGEMEAQIKRALEERR